MQFNLLLVAAAFAYPNGVTTAANVPAVALREAAEVVEEAAATGFKSFSPVKKAAIVGGVTVLGGATAYGGAKGIQKIRAHMAEKKAAKLAAKEEAMNVTV
jgi:hypothetical protein